MKNYNSILTKKQQKYQHYHLEKIDRYKYLTGEEILTSNSDGDLRFFVNGSILETNFSELKITDI